MKSVEHSTSQSSCEQALEQLTQQLEFGKLSDQAWAHLIEAHPSCEDRLTEIYELWMQIGELPTPEPSSEMDTRFYQMLDQYERAVPSTGNSFWNRIQQRLSSRVKGGKISWTVGVVLFLLGIFSGQFLQPGFRSGEIQQLSQEVKQMRELTLLTLIEQSSVTDRLKGIHLTKDISQPDPSIIYALSETLNHDPNVNVRLSALEALARLADNPEVRSRLIEAIPHQESPLIQLSLAELMLTLQEANSLDALKELLQSPQIEPDVEAHVKATINSLS